MFITQSLSSFLHMVCTLLVLFSSHTLYAQNETDSTVTDYDGNVYPIVQIGDQIWMAQNLRSTHYSDGTPLEHSLGMSEIAYDDTTKRYFYYDDNASYAENYGGLYSWYAAMRGIVGDSANPAGIQGICPECWHVPSVSEWRELVGYLNDSTGPLKPGGWTGFNVVYGGVGGDYQFDQMNEGALYVTSDPGMDYDLDIYTDNWLAVIRPNNSTLVIGMHRKTCGYSVRCVRDNTDTGLNEDDTPEIPSSFELYQNYPNPFNPVTTIQYSLYESNHVVLTIHNIQGQQVVTLVNGFQPTGEHKIFWQPTGLPSGIYFCRLQSGEFSETKKLILQK